MNKTEAIRRAMQPGVEYTTVEIEALSGIAANRVACLLRHDIVMGRVSKNDEWPRTYKIKTIDELQADKVQAAIRLLERYGYEVTPPIGQPQRGDP